MGLSYIFNDSLCTEPFIVTLYWWAGSSLLMCCWDFIHPHGGGSIFFSKGFLRAVSKFIKIFTIKISTSFILPLLCCCSSWISNWFYCVVSFELSLLPNVACVTVPCSILQKWGGGVLSLSGPTVLLLLFEDSILSPFPLQVLPGRRALRACLELGKLLPFLAS